MTTQNPQVPEGNDTPIDPQPAPTQGQLVLRMAATLHEQGEKILQLTKMVVELRQARALSGLPNGVRDGLLAFLTSYVIMDIVKQVIS